MKIPFVPALVLALSLGACVSKSTTESAIDYTQEVNPFIGTDFTGNTYPGAQAPFGMVQLSRATRSVRSSLSREARSLASI